MKQIHPENPIQIEYVNHGDVFGYGEDWFTFYCGNCKMQVSGDTKKCNNCCAILQYNEASN